MWPSDTIKIHNARTDTNARIVHISRGVYRVRNMEMPCMGNDFNYGMRGIEWLQPFYQTP